MSDHVPNFLPTLLNANDIYGMIGRLTVLRMDCGDEKISKHIAACINELVWVIAWVEDAIT